MRQDQDLLEAFAKRRDEDAFAELVRRHGTMVRGVCRRITGEAEDAEDAAQAVFIVLSRRTHGLDRAADLAAWLHEVARRIALDARRRRRRRRRAEERAMRERQARTEAPNRFEQGDRIEGIDRALARLPAALREAVVLRHLEGLSQSEAAAIAGCPAGTMAWRTSLGLERLRRRFAGSNPDRATFDLEGLLAMETRAARPDPAVPPLAAPPDPLLHPSAAAGRLAEAFLRAARLRRVIRIAITAAAAVLALWAIGARRAIEHPSPSDPARPRIPASFMRPFSVDAVLPGETPDDRPLGPAAAALADGLAGRAESRRLRSGTPIVAVAGGRVRYADDWNDGGRAEVLVVVEHDALPGFDRGLCSLYSFRGAPAAGLAIGRAVGAGTELGRITGSSAMLHFALHEGPYLQMTPPFLDRWRGEAKSLADLAGIPVASADRIEAALVDDSAVEFRVGDTTIVNVSLLRTVCEPEPRPDAIVDWCLDRAEDPFWVPVRNWLDGGR